MPKHPPPQISTGFEEIPPADIAALAAFLNEKPRAGRSMPIAMVDGFLTAIVIGPEPVMPSEYLPWIWDFKDGQEDAGFADPDEAKRILGYVLGMNNRVAGPLMGPAPTFVPVFIFEPARDHRDWLTGFAMGSEFEPEIWDYAFEDAPEIFEPLDTLHHMERDHEGWEEASSAVSLAVVDIRDYFRAGEWRQAFEEVRKPFVREGPRIGRNDPCPCGSGRKFKKCCGATGSAAH